MALEHWLMLAAKGFYMSPPRPFSLWYIGQKYCQKYAKKRNSVDILLDNHNKLVFKSSLRHLLPWQVVDRANVPEDSWKYKTG